MILHDILKNVEREYLPHTFYSNSGLFKAGFHVPNIIYGFVKKQYEPYGKLPYEPSDFDIHHFEVTSNDEDVNEILIHQIIYPKPEIPALNHYQLLVENKRNDFKAVYGIEAGASLNQAKAFVKAMGVTDKSSYNPYTDEALKTTIHPSIIKYYSDATWSTCDTIEDDNVDVENVLPIVLGDYMESVLKHYRVK
jgi:hypothetical protein